MIFHTPDTTQARLASCFKRAVTLGKAGRIDSKHPLAAMWSNACLMLDAREGNSSEELAYDLVLLDWAAERIERFSQANMITGDETACAVLHQWLERLWLVPEPALAWAKNQRQMIKAPIGYRFWYPYTTRADGRRNGANDHFIADDFGNLVAVVAPC